MKKILTCLICSLFLCGNYQAHAHCSHSQVYIIGKDFYEEEISFANCDKHYMLKQTTIYYYSNGTRRNYITYTLLNDDNAILEENCKDAKHYINNNEHYFTFYKYKKYNIMNEDGEITSVKEYKELEELKNDKFIVKLNKKYGIIDYKENTIVPIKYKKFKKIGQDLFLTQLNGYWGIIDSSNKISVFNEYDKINNIHNCYLLKKEGKFGLADKNGNIILEAKNEKISKLGEFILVKNKAGEDILTSDGAKINQKPYKKIQLNRNTLEGYTDKRWEKIENIGL